MARSYFRALWLREALEADPFVKARLILWPGWETAGRPNDGTRSFVPTGIIDHHTACMLQVGHDPATCARGILAGNSVAPGPIAQMLGTFTPPGVRWTGSNVSPRLILLASGYCNHAGAGTYPWGAPEGNAYSVGYEKCGPPADGWPDEVIELSARADAAILRYNGWPLSHEAQHFEYAPTRKIDMSGAWRRQPNLSQTKPINAATYRDEINRYLTTAPTPPDPTPPTPPGDADMSIRILGSMPDPNKPAEAGQFTQEFYALFYAECDAQGRSMELQYTGDGRDPAVQQRLAHYQAAFGNGPGLYGSWPISLAGVKDNALHRKNKPEDIQDSLLIQRRGYGWTAADFAP